MTVEVAAEETSKRWSILVSRALCLFAFIFCLISFMYGDKSIYSILVIHHQIVLNVFNAIFVLRFATCIIVILICIYFVISAIKDWLEVTLVLFFTIALFVVGLVFAVLSDFAPIDSKMLENRSYNLTHYSDSDGGSGIYELFECNFLGIGCKSIHQTELLYEDKPTGLLSVNDDTREVSIVIDGEVVYSYRLQ